MNRHVQGRATAGARRAQVVACALPAFARQGYAGTTTDHIARRTGLSQPYVIRLFGSKREIFVATIRYASGRIEESICSAAARGDGDGTADRNCAQVLLRTERESMVLILQAAAASADPIIGESARTAFGQIHGALRRRVGMSAEEACEYLATATLLASWERCA